MKLLYMFLMFILPLFGASIDTKLYEGENVLEYHQEVAKLIDKDDSNTSSSIELRSSERLILKKLSEMFSYKVNVKSLPDSLLVDKKQVPEEDYLKYCEALTDIYKIIETLKSSQESMQLKRKSLSQSILNITAEDKENLLLYQLQYAFYKLKNKNQDILIQDYETLAKSAEKIFQSTLEFVSFDIAKLEKKLTDIDKNIVIIKEKSVRLNLEKERELMNTETLSKDLAKRLKENETKKIEKYRAKIDSSTLLSLAYLQIKETQKTLEIFSSIKNDVDLLPQELSSDYSLQRVILKKLFQNLVGNVALALSSVEQSAENILEYTYKKLTEPLFVFNERGISTLDISKVLLIFVLGFMIAALYKRKIMHLAVKEKLSYSSAKIISSVGYYLLAFITILVALNSIGLDLSNIGLMAGALSIGIGFGLQAIVSNLAAGIILMFERSIRLGDYIEISDTIRGTVRDMKIRSTTVTTNDNIDVIIPNSSFIQNNVVNWTLESDMRRIRIPFSVAYGTPNDTVEKVIFEELKVSGLSYIEKPPKYISTIWMVGMGSSSVDYELVVWINGVATTKPSGTKSTFLKFIYATLNKHHIQIPFPQLDLHIKDDKQLSTS